MGVIRRQHGVGRALAWIRDILVAEIDMEIVGDRIEVSWAPRGIRLYDDCQADDVASCNRERLQDGPLNRKRPPRQAALFDVAQPSDLAPAKSMNCLREGLPSGKSIGRGVRLHAKMIAAGDERCKSIHLSS